MKFTGHADYKSMKLYIDITESAKRDAIKKWRKPGISNQKSHVFDGIKPA